MLDYVYFLFYHGYQILLLLVSNFFLCCELQFYVGEVIFSYQICRVPEKEFLKAYKLHPRLKTKVNNFHRQMSSMTNSEEDYVAIRSEWTTVDRILACRLFFLE